MHDPYTQVISSGSRFHTFILWHKDPCKDGTDDSCGWFMRSRHGDKKMLEKIVKSFEFEWDCTFKNVFTGWFCPNGDPHLSPLGITMNMFLVVGVQMFGRDKAIRYMNKHLADIILFAENNVDSLHGGITRKFEISCNEPHTPQKRKERIESMASCIYAWILRDTRPCWKHPRFHFWHWRLTFRIHLFRQKHSPTKPTEQG